MIALDLQVVACNHRLGIVFELATVQRYTGSGVYSDYAQGANAVVGVVAKGAIGKGRINRNPRAANSDWGRGCGVGALIVGIAAPAVLCTVPTADIHVREAGRLPRTHGSIEGNRPIGLFAGGLCNEFEVFHG